MFGIDFPEFVVIAVVALVVLGPERLPKVARFAGLWVRRARSQWNSVKNELERELAADELRRSLQDSTSALREIDTDIRAADAEARREFDAMRKATTSNAPVSHATEASGPVAVTPSDARDHDDDATPVMTGAPLGSRTPAAPMPADDAAADTAHAAPAHAEDDVRRA